METDHSACMSVPEILARKQELFIVQILLLRVCCCKTTPTCHPYSLSPQKTDAWQMSGSA